MIQTVAVYYALIHQEDRRAGPTVLLGGSLDELDRRMRDYMLERLEEDAEEGVEPDPFGLREQLKGPGAAAVRAAIPDFERWWGVTITFAEGDITLQAE